MPPTDTLARVDADLAAGRVPMARQRLRGLVSSFPADLSLRRRLAEVYRLYDDPAEAGRWMYLEEDRDERETAAFEERYRTPVRRMRALAWRGSETSAGTAFAVERLAATRRACAEALGRPVEWGAEPAEDAEKGSVAGRLLGAGGLLGFLAMAAIWVVGLVTLLT